MLRISALILVTLFSKSNQMKIWDEEEPPAIIMSSTIGFDVSSMRLLPLIDPTLNESFEYDSVDCGEVFDFAHGESVGFDFDYLSVWSSYRNAKKCGIRFLVPPRKRIKMFCHDFNIPAGEGFCVFNTNFDEKGGSKKCYYGKKHNVMIPFPDSDKMATIAIKFTPLSWDKYKTQGAR